MNLVAKLRQVADRIAYGHITTPKVVADLRAIATAVEATPPQKRIAALSAALERATSALAEAGPSPLVVELFNVLGDEQSDGGEETKAQVPLGDQAREEASRRENEAWQERYKHGKAGREWAAIAREEQPDRREVCEISLDGCTHMKRPMQTPRQRFVASLHGERDGAHLMSASRWFLRPRIRLALDAAAWDHIHAIAPQLVGAQPVAIQVESILESETVLGVRLGKRPIA